MPRHEMGVQNRQMKLQPAPEERVGRSSAITRNTFPLIILDPDDFPKWFRGDSSSIETVTLL